MIIRSAMPGLLALLFLQAAQAAVPAEAALDAEAARAMAATQAKGLAIAVIDEGKVVHVRSYGARNAAGDALETDTIMYGASLTKAAFAYTVMQLVEEKKLDLDKSIAEYLPQAIAAISGRRPLRALVQSGRRRTLARRHPAHFADAQRRFRQLLFHRTRRASCIFISPPGSRYAYSGDGMILLQFVIERGLGLDLGAEMQRRVFDRFGMANTRMMWRADFAKNLADGWRDDGSIEPHDERSKVRAAGSMDTTHRGHGAAGGRIHPRRRLVRTRLCGTDEGATADHHRQPVSLVATGTAGRKAAQGSGRGNGCGRVRWPARARLLQGRPQRQHRQHLGMRATRPPLRGDPCQRCTRRSGVPARWSSSYWARPVCRGRGNTAK